MAFFFFGTLMDPDVLAYILDRPIGSDEVDSAELAGFRRVCAREATYPVLVPDPEARLDGVVLLRPTPRDVLRIAHFESEEYEAEWTTVHRTDGGPLQARVFLALETMSASAEPWDLPAWAAAHKAEFLERCRTWMLDAPA
jgi:hypothetical protein